MSDIANRIVRDLLRIGASLQRVGNRITGEYGLTQQHFVVLNEIVAKGPLSQKQVVGELLYEKSNVSKIVRKLQRLGLILVTPAPDDARVTMLTATAKGRQVWAECMQQFDTWNRNWIAPLSSVETHQAARLVRRLTDML